MRRRARSKSFTGDSLRDLRHARRLTQADIAVLLGVSPRTVRNWEAGNIPGRADILIRRAFFADSPRPVKVKVLHLRPNPEVALSQFSTEEILQELIERTGSGVL